MKAVVMAGGEGTRLRPLTALRPKPLAPVMNRPIMEHSILLLKQHGISDIAITLYYLPDAIRDYFDDGSDLGVNFHYAVQETPLGTAGSILLARDFLKDDPFVVMSGDALTDVDLSAAIRFHKENKAEATLILSHVPNPLQFGVVMTDDEGRITRFLEKPSWGEVFSDTVNTGMYIIEPSVLDYMEPGGIYDWSQDIFPRMLAEGKRLFGYVMNEYWCDVGDLNQYREAQYAVLDGKVRVTLDGELRGGVWVGEGAVIDPTAHVIAPSMIGKGARIGRGAEVGPYSVIGSKCIIGEGATVHRSVLWANCYVGARARVTGATVCSKVILDRYCDVQEGVAIGANCTVERESTIRSNVKVWPDKVIEAGSTVTMSLIWGQKWAGALFRDLGVSGIANIEITPELATKLGAAFGAVLKPGSTVLTARDSGRAARMVKRAVIAGLMSVGCDVLDMRSAPIAIMRRALASSGAGGGVYVRLAPEDPSVVLIELLDARGVYLSRAAERKVETIYQREDFGRADPEHVGTLSFHPRMVETYQQDFEKHVDGDAIRSRGFRIVADFSFSRVSSVFASVLGRLGCDVIALNAFVDPRRTPRQAEERDALVNQLSHAVTSMGAEVGVMFESDGERLALVDPLGRLVEGCNLQLLYALMYARTHEQAQIAVPVTAPALVERLVALHGAQVTRTKADVRSLMAACTSDSRGRREAALGIDCRGGVILSEFQAGFDSMFAFGHLLEMLAVSGLKLTELCDGIPPVHMFHSEVRCPAEAKGRVMRELTSEGVAVGHVETLDGIKFVDETGWVLVLPDSSEPCVHVYAEDVSDEAATERAAGYVARITDIAESVKKG